MNTAAFIYDRRFTPTTAILQLRLDACREVAAKAGWEVAGVWVDTADHAMTDDRRPQLDALLDAMAAATRDGRRAVCLVHGWDRLSRTPGYQAAVMHRVHAAGGWTETVGGEHDRAQTGCPVRATR